MPIAVSCACGKSFSVADQHAGRRGKCKHCGAQVQIPTPAPVPVAANGAPDSDDDTPVWASTSNIPPATPSPIPIAITLDDDNEPLVPRALKSVISPPPPARLPFPTEPWYYRFLEAYAGISAAVGVAQFVIVTAVTLLWIVPMIWSDEGPPTPPLIKMLAIVFPIGSSLVLMLAVCLLVAPILLAVDSARNLRVIRWHLGSRQIGPI